MTIATVMPQTGAPHSPALLGSIAAQLAMLAEETEQLGVVLCSDAEVAGRYLVQLQQIDRLAQLLRELGRTLCVDDPREAVNQICLDELRGKLTQALQLPPRQ